MRGPLVWPRWSLLGYGCASPAAIVHPCPSQATKMLACEPICRVFVVSRCVRDACRCVADLACRLGSGRPQVCVNRAPSQQVSMSCVGSAVRRLLTSIYLWSHVRSVSHCRPHESPQFSKCNGSRPVRVTSDLGRPARAGRGDPVGSDVDVTLTVETVVHLGQALTLRENAYCCFVVIINSTNTVFP